MAASGSRPKALVCAPPPVIGDLLLRGADRHRARRRRLRRQPPQRFQHHERADPVIDAARDQALVGQLHQSGAQHAGVADAHQLRGLRLVFRADVDPQVRDLRGLVPLVRLDQVDGLLAHGAGHGALAALDPDPLADQDLGVPAADRREVEKAVVVDVHDHHADLVEMAGEHHPRLARGVQRREAVARDVNLGRGEGLGLVAPQPRRPELEAGRPRRVEQPLEEPERAIVHHPWPEPGGWRRPNLRRPRAGGKRVSESEISRKWSITAAESPPPARRGWTPARTGRTARER